MKGTMKLKVFGIVGILGVVLLTICTATPAYATPGSSNDVSIEYAEKIASSYVRYIPTFIANYSEWQNATLIQSTVYYDLDDRKSAYAFNVMENGQHVGYILVSATKNNFPILEFSKGKPPNAIVKLSTHSEKLAEESASKNGLSVGKPKYLYLGATFYYAEYPLIDTKGEVTDSVVVDLTVPKKIDFKKFREEIDHPINETDLLKHQQMKKQKANALWGALEQKGGLLDTTTSRKNVPTIISPQSLGWISDVPAYEWYLGCSPTAAGMVLGYWDSLGYPNFPSETTLIEELADAMETSDWPRQEGETWPWEIDNGIETVSSNHGYSNFDATNDYLITWSEVTNEVDANRPFVINMLQGGTGSGHSQPYGDHSVTALGYSDDNIYGEEYIFIHDTWDTNTHTIAFGNWWAAMATWVRP